MRFPCQRKALSIDQVLENILAINQVKSGVSVTPENCMRSPTVHSIVTAVSRRIAVSPVSVMQKSEAGGRTKKTPLPNHPITRLLNQPNDYQTKVNYWLDATSQLLRYGNAYSFKSRASRGPIRRLIPVNAGNTVAKFNDANGVIYQNTSPAGQSNDWTLKELMHARGPARDFINGDSPVTDIKEAIGLEIAAEEYGALFFGNGAVPLMVFQLMAGFKDFKDDDARREFLASVRDTLGGGNRHKAFLLPKGMELAAGDSSNIANDKAQFLETRKFGRTVIAGAFGVPPHLVGDLERATFNNVEQQDSDFTINVVLPYARIFEAAAERDLLTPEDRKNGVIIRFNLDAIQRADFKTRQDGLQIQRLNGVISANEWRERENLNPLGDDDGGDDYWQPANYIITGEDPPPIEIPPTPPPDDENGNIDPDSSVTD